MRDAIPAMIRACERVVHEGPGIHRLDTISSEESSRCVDLCREARAALLPFELKNRAESIQALAALVASHLVVLIGILTLGDARRAREESEFPGIAREDLEFPDVPDLAELERRRQGVMDDYSRTLVSLRREIVRTFGGPLPN